MYTSITMHVIIKHNRHYTCISIQTTIIATIFHRLKVYYAQCTAYTDEKNINNECKRL